MEEKKIGRTLVWGNLLTEPLFTLYSFLVFILYKDLGASTLQVALFTALKPFVTILSFYWGSGLKEKTHKLKSNILWAGFLMRAPFLLCPWVGSAWYVIFAGVNYMFFYRASLPAWLEILKRTMSATKRNRAFSLCSAIGYIEGVFLSIACGSLLDKDPTFWKILFFFAALLGLFTLPIYARIQVRGNPSFSPKPTWKERFVLPWKDSYRLIRDRPDFSKFQIGFMISGFGLMLIQPAIPLFAVDVLGISYLEMTSAICIAKGLGFSLSSSLWARFIDRFHLFQVTSCVFFAIALFSLLLCFSIWSILWFYIAYFCYGIGQGGSHLVWNMSGPIFAKEEDSSRYTGVNVAMAGLRGMIAPPLGALFSIGIGPIPVLSLSALLCLYSSGWILKSKRIISRT